MKVRVINATESVAYISCDGLPDIMFETNGKIAQDRFDFALWAILPIAMRMGGSISCEFPVSKEALSSINNVSQVWSCWLPEIFQQPIFSVTEEISVRQEETRNCVFFSGGLDSMYSALKLKEEGIKCDSISVHGMDYRFDDTEKFNLLMEQTNSFRSEYFHASYSVKTNIYHVYDIVGCNPFDGHVTHIFALFASGSLFNSYAKYFIAADWRLDQQYAAHPYGSNSATNALMHNGWGVLVTRDDDVSRSFKAGYLIEQGLNLKSLALCSDYKFRPKNCGVCDKCIRTKVMFYAKTGCIPEIFQDREIPDQWYEKMNRERLFILADALDAISTSEFKDELNYKKAYIYWRELALDSRLRKVKKTKKTIKEMLKEFALLNHVSSKIKRYINYKS